VELVAAGLDLDNEVFGQVEFGWEGSGLVVIFQFQVLFFVIGEVDGGLVYHDLRFWSEGCGNRWI